MNDIINSRQFIYSSYKNELIKTINMKIRKYLGDFFYKEIEKKINENFKNKYDLTFGHYGSYFTECSIEGSDIDLCIIYNPKDYVYSDFENILYQFLYNQKNLSFKSSPILLSNNHLITINLDIKDELIKDAIQNNYGYINEEDLTEIKIDISYNNDISYLKNCEESVKYVKKAIKDYQHLKPVYLFLKRYFKKIGMNKVFYGGISSYSLFLLVLHTIKNIYGNKNKNRKISQKDLLLTILMKFSKFDFTKKGINENNHIYKLDFENVDGVINILNPITGINVANGRMKGNELNNIFKQAYESFKEKENIFI